MNIIKNILAVILGYATFAVSAVLLFQLSGIDPHDNPTMGILISIISCGILFSFIGGLLAQLISSAKRLTINYILAAVIAGFALFSMFSTKGNHYSQLGAIFLFAPASILGGWVYLKSKKSE